MNNQTKENSKRIPQRVLNQLNNPPSRGQGLNRWLYIMALRLQKYRSADEIIELLTEATEGESIRYGEIQRQVECASAWVENREAAPIQVRTNSRWIPLNPELRSSIAARGLTLEELRRLSPSLEKQLYDLTIWEVIDILYPGNPLLCCSTTGRQCYTETKGDMARSIGRMRYIVPSPMSVKEGVTQEGKLSARSINNVGPRQYLVVESDIGTLDEQASVIVHLGRFLPLVMVVHSGNKSLHGWFACTGKTENELLTFMKHAVSLGADKALWNPCQMARMPQGKRENGNVQAVQYLNQTAIR